MIRFAWPSELRKRGVLGINQRNADFIMRFNKRKFFPLVDDKLITKELALKKGIAVPELYGVLRTEHEISEIEDLLNQHKDLVIKPAQGSGGNGILVIDGKIGKRFRKASGDLITLDTIKHHCSNILNGMYSLGGMEDKAILEYRVQFDPFFQHISYQGVPDIRVIVFRGIPVAAMIRLPTRESDGKANLHQGAIGLGIDLKTGYTTFGVHHNAAVQQHPDTGAETNHIQIPHWETILRTAVECADTVGLGYLGVDLVMDKNLGPLMLELNARPGLNVQLANRRGLLKNLMKWAEMKEIPADPAERIRMAQEALD